MKNDGNFEWIRYWGEKKHILFCDIVDPFILFVIKKKKDKVFKISVFTSEIITQFSDSGVDWVEIGLCMN